MLANASKFTTHQWRETTGADDLRGTSGRNGDSAMAAQVAAEMLPDRSGADKRGFTAEQCRHSRGSDQGVAGRQLRRQTASDRPRMAVLPRRYGGGLLGQCDNSLI